MSTIGIIGNGFVGNAVATGFQDYIDVKIYVVESQRSTHSLNETLNSDFVLD